MAKLTADILSGDLPELAILLAYTTLSGILGLTVPLAAQALVQTVALGIFLQPLILLTLGVFGLLALQGVGRILQVYLIETIQQRIYVRYASILAHKIPFLDPKGTAGWSYADRTHRFFEVITIQKSWSKILTAGPAALFKLVLSLTVLAFYSPLFLVYGVFLAVCFFLVTFGLGFRGLRTSLVESKKKYACADWLSSLSHTGECLRFQRPESQDKTRLEPLLTSYLMARQAHFRVLLRQTAGSVVIQALASSVMLGLGGYLVINRNLSFGQLVAAELLLFSALTAFEKLIGLCEPTFDLLTSLEKIETLLSLPEETFGSENAPRNRELQLQSVGFGYPNKSILENYDLEVRPGEIVGLQGPGASGKSTILRLASGALAPDSGQILLGGVNLDALCERARHDSLGYVGEVSQLISGSIRDNLFHIEGDDSEEARKLLIDLGLAEVLDGRHLGLDTPLEGGQHLSRSESQRFLLARFLIGTPRVLLLDGTLDTLGEECLDQVLDVLRQRSVSCLVASHSPAVLSRCDRVLHTQASASSKSKGDT